MKKKVLLVAASNMSLSGVPVVYMSIVRLLHHKYDFDLLIFNDDDMFFQKEFLSYGGKIFLYRYPNFKSTIAKLWWMCFGYRLDFSKYVKQNICLSDYCAIHSFNDSYPLFKEGKKAGLYNLIFHVCSASSAYPQKHSLKSLFRNHFVKKTLKLCSNILFVSKRSLYYGDFKRKGIVLYNVYDEDLFNGCATCCHDNLVLTQIGTFSSRKNQLFSLEVLRRVITFFPDATLNIVGKETEAGYLERMTDYIKKYNLVNNVNILGTTTDRKLLNANTSFILYPSTLDSFGLVLIESQASGIHCFASNTIPTDADMGNVDFVELDAEKWAQQIVKYFKAHKNSRKNPSRLSAFSKESFIKSLDGLYDK